MQLAPVTPQAIKWNTGAPRGGQKLPTDSTVEVLAFDRGLSFGNPYHFLGGVAQALEGVEVLVENNGPVPAAEVLAMIGKQLRELPKAATERLRQIIVYRGQDIAYDKQWEKSYGIPGFQAVAAGGGGQITFFGGKPYTDGVLFHEVGHNLPVGGGDWSKAQSADDKRIAELGKQGKLTPILFEEIPDPVRKARWTPRLVPGGITPYADGRQAEDISEALRMLMSEKHRGHAFASITDAAGAVRELHFGEAYPARTAVLERVTNVDLDGDGDIGK